MREPVTTISSTGAAAGAVCAAAIGAASVLATMANADVVASERDLMRVESESFILKLPCGIT